MNYISYQIGMQADVAYGERMAAKKHDWPRLHVEFLLSGEPDLATFLRNKGLDPRAGNIQRATKGWVSERRLIGERVVGVTKKQIEHELIEVDLAVKRDALKIYRSLYGLLGRTLRKRGMTKLQLQAEAKDVDELMSRVNQGELSYSQALATLQEKRLGLPADINLFAFESILRSVRLTLGLPTQIQSSNLTHQVASIADLVDKYGDEIDEAVEKRN